MKIQKINHASGTITVPGDKSISHRSVMLGALAQGTTVIKGFLPGADCLATVNCFRDMGIDIEISHDTVIVHGKGLHGLSRPSKTLYTANSGTTTRLLCGILAGQDFDCEINGDASIQKRPMKRVTQPLSSMGADIENEYCPLIVHGRPLHGTDYTMPVPSAQVKTAVLLAGLYASSPTSVHEKEKSRNHTELMLKAMGANIDINGHSVTIHPGSVLNAQDIYVPGDISSAAFFMVLGAIMPNSEITIKNVGLNPTRTGIIDVFNSMGANISISNTKTITGEEVGDITASTSNLKGTEIGGSLIPRLIDELPVIAAMAVFAKGKTIIKDAQELKVKESNRIRAVVDEFSKCGIDIKETNDGMIINGTSHIHAADFKSYGDHRMAMTLTILAQRAEGISTIDDCKCVDVSYPQFFEDFYGLDV